MTISNSHAIVASPIRWIAQIRHLLGASSWQRQLWKMAIFLRTLEESLEVKCTPFVVDLTDATFPYVRR